MKRALVATLRPGWKSRIEAAHAALNPNAEELGDILKAASRRAEQMKAEVA